MRNQYLVVATVAALLLCSSFAGEITHTISSTNLDATISMGMTPTDSANNFAMQMYLNYTEFDEAKAIIISCVETDSSFSFTNGTQLPSYLDPLLFHFPIAVSFSFVRFGRF
jgi:hypothetical protein